MFISALKYSHITQDGKIITGTKGSFSEVKLNVALPESPEKLPLYRIVDVERDSYASKDFMKPSGSVPSEEEARRLALEFLGKRGPYYSKLWYEIERSNDTAILPAENAFEISEIKPGYYVGVDQKYYIPAWLFYGEDEIGTRIVLMVDARR